VFLITRILQGRCPALARHHHGKTRMDEVIMMFSGRTSRGFKKTKKVRRPAIYAPAERRIHPFKNFDVSMQGDGRFVINLSMPGVRN